jgi:hypothetical protein
LAAAFAEAGIATTASATTADTIKQRVATVDRAVANRIFMQCPKSNAWLDANLANVDCDFINSPWRPYGTTQGQITLLALLYDSARGRKMACCHTCRPMTVGWAKAQRAHHQVPCA